MITLLETTGQEQPTYVETKHPTQGQQAHHDCKAQKKEPGDLPFFGRGLLYLFLGIWQLVSWHSSSRIDA
jgi:hypothetical protein